MWRLSATVLTIVFTLLLRGCDGAPSLGPGVSRGAGLGSSPSGPMRLQAGDKLKITVFGEDKLTGEYEVDPGGAVSLPLAGTVQAAGLTKAELEQLLARKFASEKYLRSPKVTVDISTFRPFYVLGEVEKPGEYPLQKRAEYRQRHRGRRRQHLSLESVARSHSARRRVGVPRISNVADHSDLPRRSYPGSRAILLASNARGARQA